MKFSPEILSKPIVTPKAPAAPPPQTAKALIGLGLGVLLSIITYMVSDDKHVVLLWIGVGFGYTLFHARFGFTSAFRRFLAVGNGEAMLAIIVMLAAASTLFAPILASGVGFFGSVPEPNLYPIGFATLVGGFLFGLGMNLGSG